MAPCAAVANARVNSFEFEQYRSFLTRARVRLGGKLTLLYGYNNAGKSALLRGLVLLAASCTQERAKGRRPLALEHPAARGASFEALVTRGPYAPRLTLGLGWDDGARLTMALLEVVKAGEARGTALVETLRAEGFDGSSLHAVWQPNDAIDWSYDFSVGAPDTIHFDGLVVATRYAALRARLLAFGGSVHWLPPTCEAALDRYPAHGPYDPEDPIPFLTRLGQDHPVYRDVQSALGRLAGVELSTGRDARGAYAEIAPQGLPGRAVPLASVGEGINQVLPVLTLAAMARRGHLGAAPLVAIEQPELHLHPAAELGLVDVLLEASEGDARFVLETHSETLLLGLQLAVAEGRLSPDDVSVCWVERDEAGLSTVRDIPLRPDGAREGWPPGVFSEHLGQARKILEAREKFRT